MDLKRSDDALASYDRAIALKPDYAEAYNNRGITLTNKGNITTAIESYNRALEIKPDYENTITTIQRLRSLNRTIRLFQK